MIKPIEVPMPDDWDPGIMKRIMNKIIYGKDWEFWQRVDETRDIEKDQKAMGDIIKPQEAEEDGLIEIEE